jgi:hypothetical protein
MTRLGGDRGDLDRPGAVAMDGSPIAEAALATTGSPARRRWHWQRRGLETLGGAGAVEALGGAVLADLALDRRRWS